MHRVIWSDDRDHWGPDVNEMRIMVHGGQGLGTNHHRSSGSSLFNYMWRCQGTVTLILPVVILTCTAFFDIPAVKYPGVQKLLEA